MLIYKITNLINGKIYIGQTIRSLAKRKASYKYTSIEYSQGKRFNHTVIIPAMNKYGFDNFQFEIIAECKIIEDLNQTEIDCIKQYNSLVPNGYNLEEGGKNSSPSAETRRKIGDAQLGSKNHMFGKQLSAEHKAAFLAGRHCLSEDSKKKISKTLMGHSISNETKKKISDKLKGRYKLSAKDREDIKQKYMSGDYTQIQLSLEFKVNVKMIKSIIISIS